MHVQSDCPSRVVGKITDDAAIGAVRRGTMKQHLQLDNATSSTLAFTRKDDVKRSLIIYKPQADFVGIYSEKLICMLLLYYYMFENGNKVIKRRIEPTQKSNIWRYDCHYFTIPKTEPISSLMW